MAKLILTNLDFDNDGKIINLLDPTSSQDAATKAYVDANIESLGWKDNVRVTTTSNIDLSSAPASIDGVTLNANDRVLVKNQTDEEDNGIYVFNAAASPMVRAPDANTAQELLSAITTADEGTANAGTTWRQTSVNITLGTTDLIFSPFGVVAPPASETTRGIAEIATQVETDTGTDDERFVTPLKLATWSNAPKKFTQTIGDGVNTLYTITHNLNTI
jgi:phage-related tail fiber protein